MVFTIYIFYMDLNCSCVAFCAFNNNNTKVIHFLTLSLVSDSSVLVLLSLLRLVRFWSIEERAPQAIASLSNGLSCAFSAEGSVLAAG